jgi:hypothetical protein
MGRLTWVGSSAEMPKWNADNEEPIVNMTRQAMYVFM